MKQMFLYLENPPQYHYNHRSSTHKFTATGRVKQVYLTTDPEQLIISVLQSRALVYVV